MVNGQIKTVSKENDIQGFKKGGDLDKSLKTAKKNALKNTMNEDSSSEEEDDDEESGEDIGDIDLDAEDDDDEELDSDELGDSDSEDDKIMAKLAEMKKK